MPKHYVYHANPSFSVNSRYFESYTREKIGSFEPWAPPSTDYITFSGEMKKMEALHRFNLHVQRHQGQPVSLYIPADHLSPINYELLPYAQTVGRVVVEISKHNINSILLLEVLGQLKALDTIIISDINDQITQTLSLYLPFLNKRLSVGIKTNDRNLISELLNVLPSGHTIFCITDGRLYDNEIKMLKGNSFYYQHSLESNPQVSAELDPIPDGVRLIHPQPMHPPFSPYSKKLIKTSTYFEESQRMRAENKTTVFIDSYTENINERLINSREKNVCLIEDIAPAKIKELARNIRTVSVTKNVHDATLNFLHAYGIRVNYMIDFGISQKYLGNRPYDLPKQKKHNSSDHFFNTTLNAFVPTTSVEFFKLSDAATSSSSAPVTTHPQPDGYCKLSFISQQPIDSNEQVAFVFAGRVGEALIPPTNSTRVIIVLTIDEYKALGGQNYPSLDFLLIESIKRPYKKEKDQIHTITSRRLASLEFAYNCDLNTFLMLDDNLESIAVLNKNYDEPNDLNNSSELTIDNVYQVMNDEMNNRDSLFVSASSRSHYEKELNERKLGSKCHLWNAKEIKKYLPSREDFLCLMPENEHTWGQVLLAQLVLKSIASVHRPVIVLGRDKIQLTRSRKNRNATQRLGVRAREIEISDEYGSFLEGRINNGEPIFRAITMFNDEVRGAVEQFDKRTDQILEVDLERHHAEINNIQLQDMPIPSKDGDFRKRLYENLKNLLDKKDEINQTQGVLHPHNHQWEALEFLKNALEKNQSLNRVLFNIATGCGKTFVQALLAVSALASSNRSVVVVTPYQNLTEQTYDAFIQYIDKFPVLSSLYGFSKSKIIKVYSDDGALSAKAILHNQQKDARYLYIVCERSFSEMCKHEHFTQHVELVLFDESHMTAKKHHKKFNSLSLPLFIHSTATPKKREKTKNTPVFQYTREQGINDGLLAPLLVDKFNDALNNNQLIELITKHRHSNGLALLESKGLIFVSSQGEARKLCKLLKREVSTINCYQISSENPKRHGDLACYKNSNTGIAIAVNMLVEGFDDRTVNWAIILKSLQEDKLEQTIGRILRANPADVNKIGLLICSSNTEVESIFPQNSEIPQDYSPVNETINIDESLNPSVIDTIDVYKNELPPIDEQDSETVLAAEPSRKRALMCFFSEKNSDPKSQKREQSNNQNSGQYLLPDPNTMP